MSLILVQQQISPNEVELAPMGCSTSRVETQHSIIKCCVCQNNCKENPIEIKCKSCTDGCLCSDCKLSCMEHGQLDKCPLCRNSGDWYYSMRDKKRVVVGTPVRISGAAGIAARANAQVDAVDADNEPRVYCKNPCSEIELDPFIKQKLDKILSWFIQFCVVFVAGIIGRLITGTIVPMFTHPEAFIVEFMLTLCVGMLTIIFAFLCFLGLGCICTPIAIALGHNR